LFDRRYLAQIKLVESRPHFLLPKAYYLDAASIMIQHPPVLFKKKAGKAA
jgi:hypothetical protein